MGIARPEAAVDWAQDHGFEWGPGDAYDSKRRLGMANRSGSVVFAFRRDGFPDLSVQVVFSRNFSDPRKVELLSLFEKLQTALMKDKLGLPANAVVQNSRDQSVRVSADQESGMDVTLLGGLATIRLVGKGPKGTVGANFTYDSSKNPHVYSELNAISSYIADNELDEMPAAY